MPPRHTGASYDDHDDAMARVSATSTGRAALPAMPTARSALKIEAGQAWKEAHVTTGEVCPIGLSEARPETIPTTSLSPP
jgi:hypothetical protein